MFTLLLHSSMNQKLFEMYVCNQSNNYEKYDGSMPQFSSETEVSLSAMFMQLNAQLYKSRIAWKAPL